MLSPISIATAGYVCGTGPASIPIATDGYVCTAGIVITPEPEQGGGSGGEREHRNTGHGHIVSVRLPGANIDGEQFDDEDFALLAVILIEEFFE